jgi:UDP-2,3-diacylglucosamine pyrophosphatase LpxH
MIVVLSDLHFSETESTKIGSQRYSRNLPADVFRAYFSEVNQIAVNNHINKVDLVLAGDIFEISRSGLWLEGDCRPYINNGDVEPGSKVEMTILRILGAIKQEEKVKEILRIFRNLDNYFDMDAEVHLILGNHDRLLNATPIIRKTVREILGLEGDGDLIDHYKLFLDEQEDPFCFIRHGHEYDLSNFSLNVHKMQSIPKDLPKKAYEMSSLGDIISIEYGAALPWTFVNEYGEEAILENENLQAIYKRLMEFDDVRPTTAWLAYLFSTPSVDKRETWKLIKPSFTHVINTLSNNALFREALKQSAVVSSLVRVILITILKSGLFKKGIPYWLIKSIMRGVSKSIKLKPQANWAKREALFLAEESTLKCIVSGHTHFSEVSLLSSKNGNEKYYINTGTWRNVIPATRNFENFGQLKALTKLILFYPHEKDALTEGLEWSFRYMSGVSYGEHRDL